jgi:integrase
MRLTDISVRALKAPERGQKTHFDETLTGFGVRVSPGGTKTFVLMYGASRRLVSVGRVGIITLANARDKARQMLAKETLGVAERPSMLVKDALELFFSAAESRLRPRTLADYRRLLTRHLRKFAKRTVGSLTNHELTEAIDELVETPSEQNHAFAAMRTFFRFCVRRGLVSRSPLEGVQMPARIPSRDRVLDDRELKAVLRASKDGGHPFGTLVQLLIHTGQRKGEISQLRWSWIDHTKRTITVPAEVSKNRRQHTFPYGKRVASILASVPHDEEELFRIHNWDKRTDDLRDEAAIPHFTLHDLRRTYASGMAALGIPPHVVEKLLNHITGTISGVSAIYNRYQYWDEQVEAVAQWEAKLASLSKQ